MNYSTSYCPVSYFKIRSTKSSLLQTKHKQTCVQSQSLPADEGHLVSSQVDVVVREDVDDFIEELCHEVEGGVDGRVDGAKGAIRLALGVAGSQKARLTQTPGLCVACRNQ